MPIPSATLKNVSSIRKILNAGQKNLNLTIFFYLADGLDICIVLKRILNYTPTKLAQKEVINQGYRKYVSGTLLLLHKKKLDQIKTDNKFSGKKSGFNISELIN